MREGILACVGPYMVLYTDCNTGAGASGCAATAEYMAPSEAWCVTNMAHRGGGTRRNDDDDNDDV